LAADWQNAPDEADFFVMASLPCLAPNGEVEKFGHKKIMQMKLKTK
jgi:hypothetical protein